MTDLAFRYTKFQKGAMFYAFSEQKRNTILAALKSVDGLIPSFHTFLRDLVVWFYRNISRCPLYIGHLEVRRQLQCLLHRSHPNSARASHQSANQTQVEDRLSGWKSHSARQSMKRQRLKVPSKILLYYSHISGGLSKEQARRSGSCLTMQSQSRNILMIAIAPTGWGCGRDTKRSWHLAFRGAIDHWVKAPFGRLANGIHAHVETQGYVLMQQA